MKSSAAMDGHAALSSSPSVSSLRIETARRISGDDRDSAEIKNLSRSSCCSTKTAQQLSHPQEHHHHQAPVPTRATTPRRPPRRRRHPPVKEKRGERIRTEDPLEIDIRTETGRMRAAVDRTKGAKGHRGQRVAPGNAPKEAGMIRISAMRQKRPGGRKRRLGSFGGKTLPPSGNRSSSKGALS